MHSLLRIGGHCMTVAVSHGPVVRDEGGRYKAGLKTHHRPHAVIGIPLLHRALRRVYS